MVGLEDGGIAHSVLSKFGDGFSDDSSGAF